MSTNLISRLRLESKKLTTSTRAGWGISLLSFVFVAGLALFGIYRLTPPGPAPASAPLAEFSAARAMAHVSVLAEGIHPMGSPEMVRLHDYLARELTALGLEIEPRTMPAGAPLFERVGPNGVVILSADPLNVIARLKGVENTRALLLVAHYDSTASALNASDGGAGVAAILETLRALKAGPPLKNDILVLFTDGEELDRMGMRAFANYEPYFEEVGLVLNFVARGTSGPAIMFETGPENGWVIDEFARSASYPVASSLAYDVYRYLLSNVTDFGYLRGKGTPGLDFAYIGDLFHYDTLLDNPQSLDPRSLQHMGSQALALTRHFGQRDLRSIQQGDAVYFDLWGLVLVRYPQTWAVPLGVVVTAVFVGVMVLGFRKKQLTWPGLGLGILAVVSAAIGAWAGISLIWELVRLIHPEYRLTPNGDVYNSRLYLAGFAALTIAIASAIWLLFRRKISAKALTAGALGVWWILMLASSIYLPGASYLFTWPLLFSLLSLAFAFTAKEQDPVSMKSWAVIALGALPGLVLVTPTLYLFYQALGVVSAGLVMGVVVLLLGLLIPHLELVAKPYPWLLPRAAALLGLGYIVAGSFTAGFSAQNPRFNTLAYYLNTTKGEAVWFTSDRQLDEWTSMYIKPGTERKGMLGTDTPVWHEDPELTITSGPAPVAQLPAPQVKVLSDETRDGVRTVTLHVTPRRRVEQVSVFFQLPTPLVSIEYLRAGFYEHQIDFSERLAARKPENPANVVGPFSYHNPPAGGVDFTIALTAYPLKLVAFDLSHGFPELPGVTLQPRPDYMMPSPLDNRRDSAVFVSQAMDLP